MHRPRITLADLARRALHRGLRARYDALHVTMMGVAGGLAWEVATLLHSSAPLLPALAALFTVQTTVHSSLLDGLRRVVATTAGILMAMLLLKAFPPSPWGVILLVVLSVTGGRVLGLGHEGTMQIPATALFVYSLGATLPPHLFVDRVFVTTLGVVIGVAVSFLAHPQTPEERAKAKVEELSLAISSLLGDLAEAVSSPTSAREAASYLSRSRRLQTLLEEAEPLVATVHSATRWSGKKRSAEADELTRTLRSLEHATTQVNAIARNLFDALAAGTAPALPEVISEVLEHTADAFAVHAEEIAGAHASLQEALDEVRDVRENSLATLRDVDDTGVWLLSGAILSDVDKMVDQLEGVAPALEVSTGEHAVLPVMRVALSDALAERRPRLRTRLPRRSRPTPTGPHSLH